MTIIIFFLLFYNIKLFISAIETYRSEDDEAANAPPAFQHPGRILLVKKSGHQPMGGAPLASNLT